MDDFIYSIIGFILGAVITLALSISAWNDVKTAHHRDAYNEYGQLTCEICKALAEKGAK